MTMFKKKKLLLPVFFLFLIGYAVAGLPTLQPNDSTLTYSDKFNFTGPSIDLQITPYITYDLIESKLDTKTKALTPIIEKQNGNWKYGLNLGLADAIDTSKVTKITFKLTSSTIKWKEAKIVGQRIVYGDWYFDFSDLAAFELKIVDVQTIEITKVANQKTLFLDPIIGQNFGNNWLNGQHGYRLDAQTVYFVNNDDSKTNIVILKSTDNGSTWNVDINLTQGSGGNESPSVAFYEDYNVVVIAFSDTPNLVEVYKCDYDESDCDSNANFSKVYGFFPSNPNYETLRVSSDTNNDGYSCIGALYNSGAENQDDFYIRCFHVNSDINVAGNLTGEVMVAENIEDLPGLYGSIVFDKDNNITYFPVMNYNNYLTDHRIEMYYSTNGITTWGTFVLDAYPGSGGGQFPYGDWNGNATKFCWREAGVNDIVCRTCNAAEDCTTDNTNWAEQTVLTASSYSVAFPSVTADWNGNWYVNGIGDGNVVRRYIFDANGALGEEQNVVSDGTTYTQSQITVSNSTGNIDYFYKTDTASYFFTEKSVAGIGTAAEPPAIYGLTANFTNSTPAILDTERGITSTTIDLNDLSTTTTAGDINQWLWKDNSSQFSTDQNTTRTYSVSADHNICLTASTTDLNEDTFCKTISIQSIAQGLSFTTRPHELGLKAWNIDFNGTATNESDITSWVWDFNSSGKISGQDINHTFSAFGDYNVCLTASVSDSNKMYCDTISTYLLTVKIPLNEKSSVEITPFTARIESGSIVQDQNGLDMDTNFFLINTTTYRATVADSNGNYYPASYLVTTSVGTSEYTLQPYLSDEVYTLFYVFDNYAKTPLANVRIQIQRSISNVGVQTISETLTDSTGTASASFVIGGLYTINFYYEDELKYSMTLVPSSTDPIYIYLDLTTTTPITPLVYKEITVSWQPDDGSYYVPDTNILDFNQTISIINGTIQTIQIIAVNDGNTLYDQNFSSNGGTFSQSFDLNSISVGYPIYYTILIYTTDGNYFFYYTNYVVKPTTVFGTFMSALDDIKNALGENLTGIIAIFVTMIICGGAVAGTPINMKGSSILAGVMLGIFTFIGWLNFYLFALIAFGILALWLWSG